MEECPNATGRMSPRDGKQNPPWKGEEPEQGAWGPRVWAVLTEEKPSWGLIRTFVPIHCARVSFGLPTNQILSRKTGPGSLSFDRKTGRGSPSFDVPPGDPAGRFRAAFLTAGLAPWKDLGRVCHLQRVNLIVQWFSITYTVSDTAQSIYITTLETTTQFRRECVQPKQRIISS